MSSDIAERDGHGPAVETSGLSPSARFEEADGWTKTAIRQTEATLDRILPCADGRLTALHAAMRYAVFGGGKRLRPLLCHAAGELVDASREALAQVSAVIEMIHVFSLIQDDLPAMDNDDLRHGRLTLHKQYDVATALLASDGLISQAFLALSEAPLPLGVRVALMRELASSIGPSGLTGGQYIDLTSIGAHLDRTELEQMHRMKTGALIRAAVRMGVLCGTVPGAELGAAWRAVSEYGERLGLAYQVVDDILDSTAATSVLGKTAGKDARANKATYVTVLGLDASRAWARQLADEAWAALAPFGGQARFLRKLVERVLHRLS
ncbi:polyprenyl synthetase family protein [Burkholderia pseudomallei]|uniref:polyprenyl synthetase family protein n=1 Tax=Burkholderia pseudomallei TaxID=28450 RepID=UPI0009B54E9C|nr:farnesyl diphosphate synthase [Burkholderia pseudomallei]MBG1251326.1 polyprenyl synthetase family protein [Burkholderia pseudomallei]MCL4668155.1 polyprenyl synthetase family protein [Burkholderia pseudomallei]RPE10893.1 polyprenyl synthetase family protein [Burkholderia pseudomallei]RPE18050.1 polyprenyl synthetase family protein [Burkholderia pseudomallei]RQS85485.1 polyprenyl synthetase family protein [Burkholderia pseudomallei]